MTFNCFDGSTKPKIINSESVVARTLNPGIKRVNAKLTIKINKKLINTNPIPLLGREIKDKRGLIKKYNKDIPITKRMIAAVLLNRNPPMMYWATFIETQENIKILSIPLTTF